MVGDLFDGPWKILIIALVVMVLFGSAKLPSAARSLGQSMRILQKEVRGRHEEEPDSRPPGAPAAARTPAGLTAGAFDLVADRPEPVEQDNKLPLVAPLRGTGSAPASCPSRSPLGPFSA